jgi:hypothetical protein
VSNARRSGKIGQAGTLAHSLRKFEAAPRRVSLVYAGQGLLPLKLHAFLDFAAMARCRGHGQHRLICVILNAEKRNLAFDVMHGAMQAELCGAVGTSSAAPRTQQPT